MGGSTLLLLLAPSPGSSPPQSSPAGASQFVGPFGWSFFFQASGSTPTPTPTALYRDDDAYAAMVDLLAATNEFDKVIFGTAEKRGRSASKDVRVCTITPGQRAKMVPQPSPYRKLRVARYTLTITVSGKDAQGSRAELDRLFAVVHNTLHMQPLGGFTLFDQSLIDQDAYSDQGNPTGTIAIGGQLGYVVSMNSGGFRTTA